MSEETPASKPNLGMRVVLIVVLILVLIMAIGQGKLRSESKRAVGLYEEATAMDDTGDITARTAKLKEAESILESNIQKPLSIIRLRGGMKKSLGQVKMQLAVDRALKERSDAAYAEAVRMLEEAQKLDPESAEIKERLQEYQTYLNKPKAPVLPPPIVPEE